jgi:hypothetical protein
VLSHYGSEGRPTSLFTISDPALSREDHARIHAISPGSTLQLSENKGIEPAIEPARSCLRMQPWVHAALRAVVAVFRMSRGFFRACAAVALGEALTTDCNSSLGCFAVRWWPWFSGWMRAASASIRS